MKRRKRGTQLLERTARALDLPGDVVAGLPRLELTGRGELRMTNHMGILAYGTEEICVSGGESVYTIRGRGLELGAMNASELMITGDITGVTLE